MFAANESGSRPGLRHALAGIQAGVVGALAMFACLMIGSLWDDRSIWAGTESLRHHFFRQRRLSQSTGADLMGGPRSDRGGLWRSRNDMGLDLAGPAETGWPCMGQSPGCSFILCFTIFCGSMLILWSRCMRPTGSFSWGTCCGACVLARSPKYSRHIAESMAAPSLSIPAPTAPADVQAAAQDTAAELGSGEVRSGEVIR